MQTNRRALAPLRYLGSSRLHGSNQSAYRAAIMASTQTFAYFPVRSILLPLARCPPPRAAPLTRDFLSDDVWSTATVQANTRLGFDKDLLARQMMLRQGRQFTQRAFAASGSMMYLPCPKPGYISTSPKTNQRGRSKKIGVMRS